MTPIAKLAQEIMEDEEQLPTPFEFEVTALNGIKICHRSMGDPTKPTVLLIQGHGASMAKWGPLVQDIVDAGYRVIMFDNRGAGLTESGEDEIVPDPVPLTQPGANPDFITAWCVDDMADDAIAVLDHYRLDKAHIVGASMGGLIAQNVAVRHPQRCRTVVPIMTTHDPLAGVMLAAKKNPEWFGKLMEVSASAAPVEGMPIEDIIENSMPLWKHICTDEAYPNWRPDIQEFIEESTEIDFARGGIDWGGKGGARQTLAINSWRASKLQAHKEGLERLAVPTLVLHGRYDPLFPVEAGRELAQLIPDARYVEYNGGHNFGNHDSVTDFILAAIIEHITLH